MIDDGRRDTTAQPKSIPDWATEPFNAFLDKAVRVDQLLHMSLKGVSVLRAMPNVLAVLSETDSSRDPPGEAEKRAAQLPRAKEEAELARREVEEGFPLLHEQALFSLWGFIEELVRGFVARWLERLPETYRREHFAKLKVRLGDYFGLDAQERAAFVVEVLERELGASLKMGVGRFDCLLEAIGLTGGIEDKLRRDLLEMSQLRNCIAHRGGIADRRFVDACPWLGMRVGEPVRVTHDAWLRYNSASQEYVLELIQRVRVHFGLGRYVEPKKEHPPTEQGRPRPASSQR